MPKVPMHTLACSSATETYALYATRNRVALRIVPGSYDWFAWLDGVSSFAFAGKSGHYTARKETRQRGGRYWYAYLATSEQLTKNYLGRTSHLTLARQALALLPEADRRGALATTIRAYLVSGDVHLP